MPLAITDQFGKSFIQSSGVSRKGNFGLRISHIANSDMHYRKTAAKSKISTAIQDKYGWNRNYRCLLSNIRNTLCSFSKASNDKRIGAIYFSDGVVKHYRYTTANLTGFCKLHIDVISRLNNTIKHGWQDVTHLSGGVASRQIAWLYGKLLKIDLRERDRRDRRCCGRKQSNRRRWSRSWFCCNTRSYRISSQRLLITGYSGVLAGQ